MVDWRPEIHPIYHGLIMTGTRLFFIAAIIACLPSVAHAQNTTPRMQGFHHKFEIPNNSTARTSNANNEDSFSVLQKKKTRAERQKERQDRMKNKQRGQNLNDNTEESRTAEITEQTHKGRRERQNRQTNRQTRAQQTQLMEKGAKTLSKYLND